MPVAAPRADFGDTVVALDIHLPFSYWRERDFDHGDPAGKPNDALVARYTKALMAEIASLGADVGCGGETAASQQVEAAGADAGDTGAAGTSGTGSAATTDAAAPRRIVGSAFFSGGYLGLLYPDDFRDILRSVRRNFYVTEGLTVEAATFPGSVDMYAASAYLDEHVGALMFELPTLSARESRDLGLPNALQALDKTLNVLGSYGAGEFGLRLPVDVPGRTAETWRYLLGQINHYRPAHVEFVALGTPEEQAAAFADEGLAGLRGALATRGYREVAPDFMTRADTTPAFVAERMARKAAGRGHEYLGVGLGAQTLTDGFWTKNTTDLQRYLACGGDYRALIEVVREV